MELKRSPLKRGNSQLKKGGGLRAKPKTEEQKQAQKDQYEADWNFYMSIWNSMPIPRRCFETGKLLPTEPNLMMFHHCLTKSNYPQFRHKAWNIVVLLPEVHSQVHSDDSKTPRVKKYTETLKENL